MKLNFFVIHSRYIEPDIKPVIKSDAKEFIVLTLNISINAKFDNLYPVINNLSSMDLYSVAICLQDTWLSSDADVSLLHIPGYKTINQDSRCTRQGGLIIYLHEEYTYKLQNVYTLSVTCIWRVYSSMSQVKIFAGLLLSATFTNDHITATIMPISKHSSQRFRPWLTHSKRKINMLW